MSKVSNVFIVFHCFSPFFIVFHCLSSIFWNIEKSITNTSFLTSFSMKDAESAQFTPSSFWGIFRWLHIIDVNKSEIVPVFVVNQICGDLHRLIVQNQFFLRFACFAWRKINQHWIGGEKKRRQIWGTRSLGVLAHLKKRMHTYVMHPCAMHTCAMHPCAMHPCAMHPCAMHPCVMHPCTMHPCAMQQFVGHTAWAPEGCDGRSQAGPKGQKEARRVVD